MLKIPFPRELVLMPILYALQNKYVTSIHAKCQRTWKLTCWLPCLDIIHFIYLRNYKQAGPFYKYYLHWRATANKKFYIFLATKFTETHCKYTVLIITTFFQYTPKTVEKKEEAVWGGGADRVNQWKDAMRAALAWQSPTEQQAGILSAKPLQAPEGWGVSHVC